MAETATTDTLCGECGWEQSHTRHHDPRLYNHHAFVLSGVADALGADIVEPVEDAVARGAIPFDPRSSGRDGDRG